MSNYAVALLGLVILVVLIFKGMHIGIAMALVGFVGTWYMRSFNVAIGLFVNTPFATVNSESLIVIPLFTLMGVICAYAGISRDLYTACYKMTSRMRGGLAIATEIACAFFAAICGSATATTASMGKICLEEMDKYEYKRTLTCGSISAGGTLGILIPPSVGFMLYGINSGIGVGRMFMAGIFPGILLCFCYSAVVYVLCLIDPDAGPKGPKFSAKERLKALLGTLPVLILFALVLGGILFGWFSASEGASIGAAGAFLFMIMRRKFTWKNLIDALQETLGTTAMIFIIMIGASILSGFFSATGLPQAMSNFAATSGMSPIMILIMCLFIYAVLGCFVDSLPLIVLLTPIFIPVITNISEGLGFSDPMNALIWFGVLMVMLMQLGLITPPVGLCCYVMNGVAKDTPLSTVFRGTAPFIVGIVVAIAIVIMFPWLSTWLPSVMRYGG